MISRYFLKYSFLLFVIFTSCKKDKVEESKNPVIQIENGRLDKVIPKENITTYLQGFILDESGKPIVGAQVKVDDVTKNTDASGLFSFGEIEVRKDYLVIQAQKDGYFKGIRTISPSKNAFNEVTIMLMVKGVSKNIESQEGGEVVFDGGKVKLNFPKNVVVDTEGSLYKGKIIVNARYINPESENFFYNMPGALVGLNYNEEIVGLISYGMATVELQDEKGNKLEIAEGKSVQVTMPAILDKPEDMPIWHFNEQFGVWVEAGKATKLGSDYTFEANYFSTWNLDVKYDGVDVVIIIQDGNGRPIANQSVNLYNSNFVNKLKSVKTNNEGLFNLIRAPRNLGIEVNYLSESIRKEVLIDKDTVIVTIEDDNRSFTLIGNLTDCEAFAYENKYFYMQSSENEELNFGGITDASGNFEITRKFSNVSELVSYDVVTTVYFKNNVVKQETFKMKFNGKQKLYFIDFCRVIADTLPITKIVDIDSNEYKTTKIGSQTWMAENLRTSRLNDSTYIFFASNNTFWKGFPDPNPFSNRYTCYDFDENNNDKYGKIYNINLTTSTNVCPEGWRLPKNSDWEKLKNYIGENSGDKLKEVGIQNWIAPNLGATDEYDFNAKPSGFIESNSDFSGLGTSATWWTGSTGSSSQSDVLFIGYYASIDNNSADLKIVETIVYKNSLPFDGHSIRCIKEE